MKTSNRHERIQNITKLAMFIAIEAIICFVPFLGSIQIGPVVATLAMIPVIIVALIAAFSTTADTMSTTIATLCTKDSRHDEEPAIWQKIVWGVSIGLIACIMVAFGGGAQGVDGVKYLAACGGFVVLAIFVLQVAAAIKVFFLDPETKKDIVDSVDQVEKAEK